MAGLHDNGCRCPYQRVGHQPEHTRKGEACEVELILEGIKALFHVMDAEKQEAQPGQNISDAAPIFIALENQHDCQCQHGHGVGRNFHLEPKAGNKPGPGRCANIRTKNDADACHKRNEASRQEGNGDDRNQRTRLHQRRGEDAEADGAGYGACRSGQELFKESAGE